MKAVTGVLGIVCVLMIGPVCAATIYVDDCSSPGDGSSSSTPLCSIEAGASVASPGDTITVLPGTYRECFELSKPGLRLLAEDFETNEKNNTTVIDGRGVCDNSSAPGGSGSVIILGGGALVRGFTIRGGGRSAVFGAGSFTLAHNVIDGGAGEYGGGIRGIVDSAQGGAGSIVIEGNTIQNSIALKDGGAIFVLVRPSPGASASVEILGNVVKSNIAERLGAGIAVLSDSLAGGTVFVSVADNTVDGNRVLGTANGVPGFGGGIWASTNGEGGEVLQIVHNSIASNIAAGAGGGVSVWMRARGEAAHAILVERNTLTSNRALGDGGGGLDLYLAATDLPSTAALDLTARSNDFSSNVAEAGDGGGILATALVARTAASGIRFDVESNALRNNLAVNGAGAALVALAEDPGPPAANAAVRFAHNLVVFNRASQSVAGVPSGAGVDVLAMAAGASTARLALDSNTFDSNSVPYASGGISVVTRTSVDPSGTGEGTAWITIANSIVSNNQGFGIGGEIQGSPEHTSVSVSHNDVYGNSAGAYQASIGVPPPENGNIEFDPLLEADWSPSACSPTIDAADPAADFSLEPQPNGGRANQGHSGGTSSARRTLPDINGDRLVDGVEILAIASSFGATQGQPRYNSAADVNKDGTVEGEDLSIVGSDFGVDCRP